MHITNLETTKKQAVDMDGVKNVIRQVPISKNDGTPSFSFRVFTLGINGHTPYHRHSFEHVNYVISGNGAIVNESGEELSIKTGDFAMILPDEKHQYRNKSESEPMVMICAVPVEYE